MNEVMGINKDSDGFLLDPSDWDHEIAAMFAKEFNVVLTDEHWDVIKYLRDEFINNNIKGSFKVTLV